MGKQHKHVIGLDVRDLGGVKAFWIKPDGGHVVIGGKNAAGKSSALLALRRALQGARKGPPVSVRDGADKGEVVVEFEDLRVRWVTKAKGGDSLVLETPEGAVMKAPQAKLEALMGHLLDPLEFFRSDPKSQARILAKIAGIDLDAAERARRLVYDERTVVNRMLKDAEGALSRLPPMPDHVGELPERQIDLQPIIAEATEAKVTAERNRINREHLLALEVIECPKCNSRVADAEQEKPKIIEAARRDADRLVEEAEIALRQAQERLEKAKARRDGAVTAAAERADQAIAQAIHTRDELTARIEKGRAVVDGLVDPDIDAIASKLENARRVNTLVEHSRTITAAAAKVAEKRAESVRLTATLAELDAATAATIAAAPIPVEGLGLTDGEVTYQGRKLHEMASSEALRVSVALAISDDPEIRILPIDRWGDLDEDSRAIVREMADAHDFQILTTIVGEKDEDITVVIRDGSVVGEDQEQLSLS